MVKKDFRMRLHPEVLVGDGGFEPPKALPADLQSVPFGHSGNPPCMKLELVDGFEPPTC